MTGILIAFFVALGCAFFIGFWAGAGRGAMHATLAFGQVLKAVEQDTHGGPYVVGQIVQRMEKNFKIFWDLLDEELK